MSTNSSLSVYTDGSKITIPNGWVQVSNYAPSAGQYFAFWNNTKTFINTGSLVPADANRIVGQVTFNVIRAYRGSNNSYTYSNTGIFARTDSLIPNPQSILVNQTFDLSTRKSDVECLNIYPRWCGDGIVSNGEQCDGTAGVSGPNQSCNASCQIVNLPSCTPGTTTGAQMAPITSTTPGLCQGTAVVGDFSGVTVGNRTNYVWSCGGSAVGGACSANYTDPSLTPACNPAVTGAQPNNPSTRTPAPALCANGTVTGVTTSGSTLSGTLAWSCERSSVTVACSAYWNPSTQIAPQCGGLVANPTGSVAPSTQVTYTCSILGYSGSTANLEYNIRCSDIDTGSWGTGATRVCTAPATNSTTTNISCAVRDRTNTGVVFTGSNV